MAPPNMKMLVWCSFFVLTVGARIVFALNDTKLSDLAVISRDDDFGSVTTKYTAVATTDQSLRQSRWQYHEREGYGRMSHDVEYQEEETDPDHHHEEAGEMKAVSQAKTDYWGGYYDFLINEGSYKFWAVFQLATAALLIYSGFAALYYAKVNPQINDDYDDFLLRRRRRFVDRDLPPSERSYFGFQPESLQRILDAIAQEFH